MNSTLLLVILGVISWFKFFGLSNLTLSTIWLIYFWELFHIAVLTFKETGLSSKGKPSTKSFFTISYSSSVKSSAPLLKGFDLSFVPW